MHDQLIQVRDNVFAYLAHLSYKQESPMMAQLDEAPDRPEELDLLTTLDTLGTRFAPGGYINQPWILVQHLEAAMAGRAMHMNQELRVIREPNDAGEPTQPR